VIDIESSEFKQYLKSLTEGERTGKQYAPAVEHAEELALHAYGKRDNPIFKKLIETQRPNETDHVKAYRVANWQPITRSEFGRVYNTLIDIFTLFEIVIPACSNEKSIGNGLFFLMEGKKVLTYENILLD